ncbi:PREDICTED: uncharacterized protein LOC18600366 [Theobroma cacao]|uniref:Uncharacterized protein LOC18600366 n=1 Tax=Theobroma cacao TaxID=3641 RepID=A0AB32WDY6_THECC|nr:PREDICTED: uncharacterized protein LOC18600366 [Theobroma cacao]
MRNEIVFQGKNWGDDQCWDLVRVKVAWWAKAKWLVDFQQLEQTIRCLEVNRLHTRIRGGRQTVQWEPLNRGFLKFNVDGAAKGNPCQAAIRGVLREEEGVVKILFSIPIGISKANTAKVMAIKEAFKLFGVSKWVGSHCLIVESDSENTVSWVYKPDKAPWRLSKDILVLEGIQKRIREWQLRKINREANGVADELAKSGVQKEENLVLIFN